MLVKQLGVIRSIIEPFAFQKKDSHSCVIILPYEKSSTYNHYLPLPTTSTTTGTATTTATADVVTWIIPAVEGKKEEERK